MFYFRTPGVVFPVCFLLYHLCFRHPHAVVSGIAAGWRYCVMENNYQTPQINSLKQLLFPDSYAIIYIQKTRLQYRDINPFWGVASFLHNPSTSAHPAHGSEKPVAFGGWFFFVCASGRLLLPAEARFGGAPIFPHQTLASFLHNPSIFAEQKRCRTEKP